MNLIFRTILVFATISNIYALKAQETSTTQNQAIKVMGSCGMCKKTIESTAIEAGAKGAKWDESTKILHLNMSISKASINDVQKAIAALGYDTQNYKASDEAYNNLSECCKYERLEIVNSNKFNNVLEQYYSIKNALVNDSANIASKFALQFSDSLKLDIYNYEIEVEDKNFTTIKNNLDLLAKENDILKQREIFNQISIAILPWVKSSSFKGKLYKKFCPMKNAFWLSNEPEIKNPYFGREMLNCGSVEELIN